MEALPDHTEHQGIQAAVVGLGTDLPHQAPDELEPGPDHFTDQHFRERGGREHLPQHEAVLPIFRVIHGQHPIQEMVDERAQSLCRRQSTIESLFLRIQPASVGLAKYLDVEVLLVPEVVVDRRQIRPGPVADRPHPRQLETLLGKLLTGSLEQSRFCRILCHHVTLQSRQTTVLNNCFNQVYGMRGSRQGRVVAKPAFFLLTRLAALFQSEKNRSMAGEPGSENG